MKTVFRSIDDNLSPFETGLKKADGKNREWSLEASAESAMKIKEDEGREMCIRDSPYGYPRYGQCY